MAGGEWIINWHFAAGWGRVFRSGVRMAGVKLELHAHPRLGRGDNVRSAHCVTPRRVRLLHAYCSARTFLRQSFSCLIRAIRGANGHRLT